MTRRLQFFFPHLPPSENNIWVHRFHGGQAYSAKAKAYRRQFYDFVGNTLKFEIQHFMRGHKPECVYQLSLVYCFSRDEVLNKGWPGKAKTLIKKMDTANRRKLLEDSLVEILGGETSGIDDSSFFEVNLVKFIQEPTGVLVTLQEEDPASYGIEPGKPHD